MIINFSLNFEEFVRDYPKEAVDYVLLFLAEEKVNGIPQLGLRYDIFKSERNERTNEKEINLACRGFMLTSEFYSLSESSKIKCACELIGKLERYYGKKANPEDKLEELAKRYGESRK